VPENKIEVVRSGFDFSAYAGPSRRQEIRSELGVNEDTHLVINAARFRPSKGVEYAVRAFAKTKKERPNTHLMIAGEGEQFDFLVTLAAELGVGESITFLGRRSDVPDLLSAADSMLLTSLNEGLPRISIEAMAAGKPVIATDVGATSEVVIDDETGILLQPKDVQAASDALIRLIDSSELRSRLGESGRQYVEKNYSVDKYVERLDGLYQKLIKAQGNDAKATSGNGVGEVRS
jgi:glycosyltransferase involved in cell wall biosynthesis